MAKTTIEMLSPEAGRNDVAGLREYDADGLVSCVAGVSSNTPASHVS